MSDNPAASPAEDATPTIHCKSCGDTGYETGDFPVPCKWCRATPPSSPGTGAPEKTYSADYGECVREVIAELRATPGGVTATTEPARPLCVLCGRTGREMVRMENGWECAGGCETTLCRICDATEWEHLSPLGYRTVCGTFTPARLHQPPRLPPVDGERSGAGEGGAQEEAHPEATCQRCGRENIVCHAPNDVWNKAVPDDGILCPVCFVQAAERAGITPASWRLAPESHMELTARVAQLEATLTDAQRQRDEQIADKHRILREYEALVEQLRRTLIDVQNHAIEGQRRDEERIQSEVAARLAAEGARDRLRADLDWIFANAWSPNGILVRARDGEGWVKNRADLAALRSTPPGHPDA